jgi:hypothetical protein
LTGAARFLIAEAAIGLARTNPMITSVVVHELAPM